MPNKHKQNQPPATPQDFPIVGIGASAGGLDAFKKLLKNIPENSGMAYVLVQHLAPSHESILPKLLSKVTSLPVFEITDDIHLAPNHIYIIPENKLLTTYDGVLKLEPRESSIKKNTTIDLFFSSLSEVHKSFAIGVVLSGTGFDGSQGLKRIKEEGGITYAQTPDSATFDGMPQSAIYAGAVDFVLEPEAIPEHLMRIEKVYESNDAHSDEPLVDKNEVDIFKSIIRILRLRTGNDFTHYKEATIRRRIARRMLLTKNEEPGAYLNFLRNDKSEQDALFNDVLIPVSYFFRDSTIFELLSETILPLLLKNKKEDESIRIWTAGCSTGEEAYSLAICLHEYISEKAPGTKVQLFASDISENVITKARAAIYNKQDLQNVSEARLLKYFVKSEGHYHISKTIREMCVFAVHNFLKDPPFAKMDLISCRNVLIYLNPFLQKKAMTAFHYALKENGILFLGKSESATAHANLFEQIVKNQKIYARKSVPGRYVPLAFEPAEVVAPEKYTFRKKITSEEIFQTTAHNILFNTYTPAAVIIDEHKEIVHFHGDTGPFLVPSPGKPNFNILKMAREGITFELRNALIKIKETREKVYKEDIRLKDLDYTVDIEIVPLDREDTHMMILFHKKEIPKEDISATSARKTGDQLRIKQLENEIRQIREDIKRVTEDQEVANEELQSANEELLSNSEELQTLNEELETSAEELQSNNEELISVNDELMDRQDQLMSARLYAESIVETIREPLLILDRNMRIKSGNASFYKFFNTTEADIEGRLIYDIANRQLSIDTFRIQLEKVLPQKTKLVDYEVVLKIGNSYERTLLLNAKQIVNDKQSDQLILLAFEDITEHVAMKKLKESEERFRIVADSAPVLIWLSEPDKKCNFFNKGWLNFRGKSIDEESGNTWIEGIHPEDRENFRAVYNKAFEDQKEYHIEYRLQRFDGEYRWMADNGVPRYTPDGIFLGFVGGCMDIHESKNFSKSLEEKVAVRTEELRQSQAFLESILNAIPGVVYVYDIEEKKTIFINKNIFEATGIKPEQIQQSATDVYKSLIHPEDLELFERHRERIKNQDEVISQVEYRLKNKKGHWTNIISRDLVFERDAKGTSIQYIAATTDISEIITANERLLQNNQQLEYKNKELASFTSIASHDLKEPLRKISIFSKLINERESEGLSDNAKYSLDRIIVSSDRMQQLVDDLLNYSQINANDIVYTKTDLNVILNKVKNDLKETIEEKSAVIEAEKLPTISAIPSQFQQVFDNLLNNAIKYSRTNQSPKIMIKCEKISGEQISSLGAVLDSEYYKITIEDNGIGFPDAFKEKIFEPFKRLHGKDEFSGTGIGLAICKKIIMSHKGFINAESDEKLGSTFMIYLPV